MGNLFYFIFLTFPSFSFIFSKTEKAVQGGAKKVSNGAPPNNAPLVTLVTNGALVM